MLYILFCLLLYHYIFSLCQKEIHFLVGSNFEKLIACSYKKLGIFIFIFRNVSFPRGLLWFMPVSFPCNLSLCLYAAVKKFGLCMDQWPWKFVPIDFHQCYVLVLLILCFFPNDLFPLFSELSVIYCSFINS